LIDHLREVARGRDDIPVECAGILAGSWLSSTARRGEDLMAARAADVVRAGLILNELDRWMRVASTDVVCEFGVDVCGVVT
jgi:hypothetical protein